MLFDYLHSTFLPYYYKVYNRLKTFERMVVEADKAKALEDRVLLAKKAATWATYHPTGYYASSQLEHIFLEAANTIPSVKCKPEKGKVLHVMTQAYNSGGHTRVVERWINLSNTNESHSVAIINQGTFIVPEWLNVAVKGKSGKVFRFEEGDIFYHARILRQIAASYEHIILHVHMDDPVPLLAFGVQSFTTPIVYFNHADHMFWLGVSIADMVVDFRQLKLTQKRRDVKNVFVLGLPSAKELEEDYKKGNRSLLRRELGIKDSDFVMITTGTPYKYCRIGSNHLCKQLWEVVRRDERMRCYAIGPDINSDYWQKVYELSQGRIRPLGVITDKDEYQKYLKSADLYIGSYPFSGGVASLDAVQCGLPIIQLIITRQPNSIVSLPSLYLENNNDEIVCYSTKKMIKNIFEVSRNRKKYNKLLNASKQWASSILDAESWQKRLYKMYSQCPTQHSIYQFECKKGKQVKIDDNVCLLGFLQENINFEIKRRFFRRLAHARMRIRGV